MKLEAMVLGEEKKTIEGKKGPRVALILSCAEWTTDGSEGLSDTFNFTLWGDDAIAAAGKHLRKPVNFHITRIRPGYNGKIEMDGTIVMAANKN